MLFCVWFNKLVLVKSHLIPFSTTLSQTILRLSYLTLSPSPQLFPKPFCVSPSCCSLHQISPPGQYAITTFFSFIRLTWIACFHVFHVLNSARWHSNADINLACWALDRNSNTTIFCLFSQFTELRCCRFILYAYFRREIF